MKYEIIILSFLILSSCQSDPKLDSFDKVVYNIVNRVHEATPLKVDGTGGALMDEVKLISLSFDCKKKMSIAEVRDLVLQVVTIFFDEANRNKQIRPYLETYPLEPYNIHFSITFREDHHYIDPPYIASVSLHGGMIYYYENIDNDLKRILKETYEEALQKQTDEKPKTTQFITLNDPRNGSSR